MRFVTTSLAIAAAAMMLTACTGKSSSDQSGQSSAQATEASSTAAASSAMAGANQIPDYPGATTQAAGTSNMGSGAAAGKVMSTGDSFDTVSKWYQQHLPAGSEKTHVTAPVESAVFVLGSGTDQTSVTISSVAGKTMIVIGHVKTQ